MGTNRAQKEVVALVLGGGSGECLGYPHHGRRHDYYFEPVILNISTTSYYELVVHLSRIIISVTSLPPPPRIKI